MNLKETVQNLAGKYFEDIRAIRRHIHANPELSFMEYETSSYIQERLTEFGIPYDTGFVNTGIVAVLDGKPGDQVIALRADIDALPIMEKNNVPYASNNPGAMHACGHDVHTSNVLGAARILSELSDHWAGKVVLIFQPGEEKLPGGAKLMLEEGIIEKYGIQKIIGHHVFPNMEAGNVAFRKGMYMASTDELRLTIKGKGGHAALPESYINPITIGAEIMLELHKKFEEVRPTDLPSVLAFGKVIAEGATNVIPSESKIEGTLRTLNEDFRAQMHTVIQETASGIAKERGAVCDVDIKKGYPVLYNNEAFTEANENLAREYMGEEHVHPLDLRMTADDFAYYSQQITACYYRLGTRSEARGITSNVHTDTFDIEETALETGMGLLAYITMRSLSATE